MIEAPELLTASQMARRLRVKVAWLKVEAEAERVPGLKAGDVWLFRPAAVEAVLLDRASTTGGGDDE